MNTLILKSFTGLFIDIIVKNTICFFYYIIFINIKIGNIIESEILQAKHHSLISQNTPGIIQLIQNPTNSLIKLYNKNHNLLTTVHFFTIV